MGWNKDQSSVATTGSKLSAKMKAAAYVGFGKGKAVAITGVRKVKRGTSIGIKWVKTQYQKRASK